MFGKRSVFLTTAAFFLSLGIAFALFSLPVSGREISDGNSETSNGGGYAVTGQLQDVGYTAALYDANNGLPTSDANYVYGTSDGYIWIGGYSGILRYDGSEFIRMDSSDGLTSGRAIFEDSTGGFWVGTNDNGVVLIKDNETIRYTYEDGLPSSSIRTFAEDLEGTVYIGSMSGVSCVGSDGILRNLEDERIDNEPVLRLVSDMKGRIYGYTMDGDIFAIEDQKLSEFHTSEELMLPTVSAIFPDPGHPGEIYLGTKSDKVYYGTFGKDRTGLREISVSPANGVTWITAECGRIFLNSGNVAGYLDTNHSFHPIRNIPMDNAIEMITSDYQGNLWLASSRQGVMKIVANNFRNVTQAASLPEETVNATCLHDGKLYIGTDSGLRILDGEDREIFDELTEYLKDTRIRCITEDPKGDLWISTYANDLGLVCFTASGQIRSYDRSAGLENNQIRCTVNGSDGTILAGTNGGLAVIGDGKVLRTVGAEDGIGNTVFLTVEEGDRGEIYAGTDGDGIYVIREDRIKHIGREEGLSSDVVLRIKKDRERNVIWIITSNSVEYLKDGELIPVTTFPYNNNFDLYPDHNGNYWILSSCGVFCVRAEDMLNDRIEDYRLYTVSNGLSGAPTANAYSALREDGTLYISGRTGVDRVNIDDYFEETGHIRTPVRSVSYDDREILPDREGVYTIPAGDGRIQIVPAILDYTMTNPTVRVFLEGGNDTGVTSEQSRLGRLEYTSLSYGNYDLHIQIIDRNTGEIFQDESFRIVKKPGFLELPVVRIIFLALLAALAGIIVWRVMTGTVIRRQYEEIRMAKEEADRANNAKSQFLANMSHEIRTPINTIMGMDEMIMREDTGNVPRDYASAVNRYARDIMGASESLLGLINDLLDMSKIESGKMHLVNTEYDVADLLRTMVSMIRPRAAQKELIFEVSVDETVPVRLYGDAGKIRQVVLNLLTNAVKYTTTGSITLKLSVEEKTEDTVKLVYSVKDTGIGVKEEDIDKLFTAYERLDEEKNSAIQGTGLGLDISRRYAELMEGDLRCESVYGEGSEFILTLVQKIVDPKELGVFTEQEEEILKGPYVPRFVAPEAEVLVVDDNPMNLNVITGLLKATRVFVTTASGGEECLEMIKYGTYDVVLLDHMMPGMDGVETLKKIRAMQPDLPVYALTANSAAGEDFYISEGFNGYLSKPVDPRALESAIMRHLPENIMMKPEADAGDKKEEELPEDLRFLHEVEEISIPEGIRNSGGVSLYAGAVRMFRDTADEIRGSIEKAYEEGDLRLYTVKVHALKSSLRIIGNKELSELAASLEDAGNREDRAFIGEHQGRLMEGLLSLTEKLKRMDREEEETGKEPITESELRDAYTTLKEVADAMDYDSAEMILAELRTYRLDEEADAKVSELERLLKLLDWDGIERLL